MASALRITLSPIPRPAPGSNAGVGAVHVRLAQRGDGTTLAQVGSAKAAKITFHASLLKQARTPNVRVRAPIGTLEGQVLLRPGDRSPEFIVSPNQLVPVASVTQAPVGVTPRVLGVQLDPAHFTLADPSQASSMELTLPASIANKDYNYLEIEAELEIAGTTEAPLGTNDTLDVPLYPRPSFRIRLVDELDKPLAGVALDFDVNGKHLTLVTDDSGSARVDDLGAESAMVKIVEPNALRAILKERWNKARPGPYVNESGNVLVLQSRDLESSVTLTSQESLKVSIQPRVLQARVWGLLFDTNKSFLLPSAIPSLRDIKAVYDKVAPCKLLVVGHTDTSAEAWTNDPLSLDRAKAMVEYLTDQVDLWLARYKSSVAETHRWGKAEDLTMIATVTLAAGGAAVLDANSIKLFQKTHNNLPKGRRSKIWASLPEDGTMSADTRRQLVADYMHQEQTSLPEDIEATAHGCGEYFPLNATGEDIDTAAADGAHDAMDRRVELFFFDDYCGIQPPPPASNSKKGSTEYPEWRRRARETMEYEVSAHGPLDIATFAPTADDVKLNILTADGDVVTTLTREHGQQTDNSLRFSMYPEALPNPAVFEVWRNDQMQQRSGSIDSVELRNALYVSDVDSAERQLVEARGGAASGALSGARGGGTRVAAVDPSTQPLRMVFTWQFPKHRFLDGLTMSLMPLDGAGANTPLPRAAGSVKGKYSYDVPNDATKLKFTIDVLSSTVALLHLEQKFKVIRTTGSPPIPMADGCNPPGSILHPRVQSMAFGTGQPGTTVIDVPIDLLFLDVTEHVRQLPTKPTLVGGETIGRFKHAEDTCKANGVKSRIRVLEYTGGRPSAWPVILPPDLKDKVDQGVLLFLKNEALQHVNSEGVVIDGSYTNADDADYVRALVPYWSSPEEVGKYVFTDTGATAPTYHDYPYFGWDVQLRNTKRSVIVMFPIPHGVDFGALDTPTPITRALLNSALTCLFCDSQVKSGSSFPPFVRHLAVGGWSSGTDTLFKWVPPATPKDAGLVEEFWIFDGKKALLADVKAWFNTNPSRRLRLIGTAYTEVTSNALRPMASNPNVFVYPGNPKYWYESAEYMASLAAPGSVPYHFRHDPSAPPLAQNDASTKSNIYIKNEKLVDKGNSVDQSIVLHSPGLGEHLIGSVSHEEAATFVIYEALGLYTGGNPVSTVAQFDAVCQWVDSQPGWGEPKHSFRHRHPWSTFGGFQGPPFVGYFQTCLEKSGL